MKTFLTAAAIIVGCASPFTFAQTTPFEPVDNIPAEEQIIETEMPELKAPLPKLSTELSDKSEEAVIDEKPVVPSLEEAIASTRLSTGLAQSVFNETEKKDPLAPKQDSSGSDWHFAFAPYIFAAGISGTVGARGRTLEIDADFGGSIWESLDIGLMGAFEIRKGRFVVLTDFMWIKLSQERDTPGRFYDTAKLGLNLFIFDPEIGYRLVDSEAGSLDVLAGVRIWSVEANLNTTTGVLEGFDVSQRKTWAAPVVGLHGVYNVTSKFFLAGKFDIGGAGIGADLTTQLYGALGFKVHKNVALVGGYRWLQVDYDDEEGFLFDTQMAGLMFGAKFSW